MLVDQSPRSFESNLEGQTAAFTIAASSKAFQILSNQLYTDKPRAILRELSTNALDAHIAAGKMDVPFEVQLPNTWESTLIVKDYGTGMSPEQITALYTTYFGSDKTHTNDLVGGLGLGSKSPFAYTDQFTAISRYDGIKYTYAAFIGSANVPEISLISQEETDEENGFEVHVPVKAADIYTFKSTAARVFEFFPVMPKLNEQLDIQEHADPVLVINVDGINCELYTSQDETMIMQGPIGYPVDVSAIVDDLGYDARSKVRTFLQKGWRIMAPVGTFEITASREGLSYDKETIQRILKLTDDVLKQVKDKAVAKLASATSVKEASDLIVASTKYLSGALSLNDATWNGMTWNRGEFVVDLPPDTRCRLIKKDRYHRRADPHDMTMYDPSDPLPMKNHKYRVLWSEKDRPYRAYLSQNPCADDERILYFTGPLVGLKSWLASVGLPPGKEMPKKVKDATGTVVTNKVNYGATKYNGYCLTTGDSLSATANKILDEPNCKILLTSDHNGSYNHREEFGVFESLGVIGDLDNEDIYSFYVPSHHTKVTKALQSHPGLIDRDLLLTMMKPVNEIYSKIAFAESLTQAINTIKPYKNVSTALDINFVKDPEIVEWMKKVDAVSDSVCGGSASYQMIRILKPYSGLDFQTSRVYDRYVRYFSRKATEQLDTTFNKYSDDLTHVIEGFESCNHWNYRGSKLQAIVTDWFNNQVAEIKAATQP